MKIEILNDVFFINQRLKEIDSNYKIFYNLDKNKFEIHNIGQIGDSYCLTVPFQYLDSRTIDFVQKTRIHNKDLLLKEIDINNQLLYEKNNKNILQDAKDRLYDQIKYNKN